VRCSLQAATLYAACFVVGAGMEAFMVKTGFYAVATRKEAGMGVPARSRTHANTRTAASASARVTHSQTSEGQCPNVRVPTDVECFFLGGVCLHRDAFAVKRMRRLRPMAQASLTGVCAMAHRETGAGEVGEGGNSAPQGRSRQIAA
jgi:hypothetical protein